MTKKSKRAELVQNIKNLGYKFLWDDFESTFTNDFGFELGKKRGSERAFKRKTATSQIIFTAHQPHKKNIFVSKESRVRAIVALERLEALLEEEKKGL
ncbi:MAG: hypothetical protein ACYC6G_11960 [Desulfobaccales bacterium]